MLLLLLHAEAAGHADRARAAVGAHAPLGRGDHRVPADLPPHAGHGRRQEARPDPLPEDRRERRGQLVAEHRREAGGGGVAAAAGDQLGHRDQGLRLAGERPGGDRGAGRGGRAGESAARHDISGHSTARHGAARHGAALQPQISFIFSCSLSFMKTFPVILRDSEKL